jgi:Lipocalin-like domain
MKRSCLGIIVAIGLTPFAQVASLAASAEIVGTWQLTSFWREWLDTKEIERSYIQPTGYLQYSTGGHMVVFIVW